MKPDLTKGLEVYDDASFAGDWNQAWNCPIVWTSKLQTEITLSTTEAEYVALSHALREAIPLINLLNEIKDSINIAREEKAEFKCI
eukprot:5816071-Ditylum_brightwellii.AAC.1